MAGLRDALEAEQEAARGPRCRVGLMLAEMEADDVSVLTAALANPAKQASVISRALKSMGHEVNANSLNRHRRGDCACDRGDA